MIRAVLDVNVLVSALISPNGTPARVLDLWRAGEFLVLTSEAILVELERVLAAPRLRKKYRLTSEDVAGLLRGLRRFTIGVTVDSGEPVVRDPDDAKFLSCAVAGKADYLVTGDADLLSLCEYGGIAVVTPAAFVRVLSGR